MERSAVLIHPSQKKPTTRLRRTAAAVLPLAAVLVALPLSGQNAPDFALGEPKIGFSGHIGYGLTLGGSDLFSDTQRLLTVGERDLDGLTLRGEVSYAVADRFDVVFGAGYMAGKVRSEDRAYVDLDELPIEQTTTFSRIPVTVGARYYLAERGRSVSQFAWIPSSWVPYVGAGGGIMAYRFEQDGDWVDTETLAIFRDRLLAEGVSGSLYLAAGADISLGPYLALNTEARYLRGKGDPGNDFLGFEPIDLSGVQATVGLAIRF